MSEASEKQPANGQETAIKPRRTRKDRRALTDRQKRRIENLYAAGRSTRFIAGKIGKPQSTVADYVASGGGEDGRLARARKANALMQIEDAGRIVDEAEPESGHVSKAREQAGHRRFVAARLDRNTWGERVEVAVSGEVVMRGILGGQVTRTVEAGDAQPAELLPGEPVQVEVIEAQPVRKGSDSDSDDGSEADS